MILIFRTPNPKRDSRINAQWGLLTADQKEQVCKPQEAAVWLNRLCFCMTSATERC